MDKTLEIPSVSTDKIIRFSLTSDGTTGEEWINRLINNGCEVSNYAKALLRSDAFRSSNGVLYEVDVLPGILWSDKDRTAKIICQEAKSRKLLTPNPEIACLIREKFSKKDIEDMGLDSIFIMHKPINGPENSPYFLCTSRFSKGSLLEACLAFDNLKRGHGIGFAFLSSQKA